jgi:hypothetical protein
MPARPRTTDESKKVLPYQSFGARKQKEDDAMMYWDHSYIPTHHEVHLDNGPEGIMDFAELPTDGFIMEAMQNNENVTSDVAAKTQAVRDLNASIALLKQEFEQIASTRQGLQMQLDQAYNNNDPQRIRILGDVHQSYVTLRMSLVRRWSNLMQDQKRLTTWIEETLSEVIFNKDKLKQEGDLGGSTLNLLTALRLCSTNLDTLMALKLAHRLKELS